MKIILKIVTSRHVLSMQRQSLGKVFVVDTRQMSSKSLPRKIVKNVEINVTNGSNTSSRICKGWAMKSMAPEMEKRKGKGSKKERETGGKKETQLRKKRIFWDYQQVKNENIYNNCAISFNRNLLNHKRVVNQILFTKNVKFIGLGKTPFSSKAKQIKLKTNKEDVVGEETTNDNILEKNRGEPKVCNIININNSKGENNTIEETKQKKDKEVKREEIDKETKMVNEQKELFSLKKNKIKNGKVGNRIYEISVYFMKSSFTFMKKTCQTVTKIILKPSLLIEYYHSGIKNVKHTIVWVKTGVLLFLTNMKISKNLIIKRLKGYRLSYSEYKLLIRTINDMFKLIPFSFFIIIPFAEFLLPVFLKIYPNLLPSTFKNDNNFNNIKKNLYAKQQLAKFLQKLIEEKEKQINENINTDMDSDKKIIILNKFHQQLINKDEKDINPFLSVNDTLKIAKLFKEDFVLDKMNLKTLQAICHLLDLKPYGIHYHVVLQLRHHFLRLQREDRELIYEGVDNLKKNTLIEICKDRGMNFNTSEKEMILQIKQWLELASIKEVPYILLLYIRCVIVTHSIMDIHDEQMKAKVNEQNGKQTSTTAATDEKEKLIQEAKEKLDDLKMKEEEIKKNINIETKDENVEVIGSNIDGSGLISDVKQEEEESQLPKDKNIETQKVVKEKKPKIDVLKHNKYMQNELDLLKQICDLQHKELKIAFTSLTDLAEKKQTGDLNELIKSMAEGISNIEKQISELNAHKQIEMDAYFYPEEEDEEEKLDETVNLKG